MPIRPLTEVLTRRSVGAFIVTIAFAIAAALFLIGKGEQGIAEIQSFEQTSIFILRRDLLGPEQAPDALPKASWKIYENDDVGFSFRHPAVFSIREQGGRTTGKILSFVRRFIGIPRREETARITIVPASYDIRAYLQSVVTEDYREEKIRVAGRNALWVTGVVRKSFYPFGGLRRSFTAIPFGDSILLFDYDLENPENEKIFDEILGTIKFE